MCAAPTKCAPREKRSGKVGRKPKHHPAPLYRVGEVIAELPTEAWEMVTWREGSKGPMRRQFAAPRVH